MNADPFSLEGKRILVTGASSGIGRQVAISCAEMGATMVVTGRNAERLGQTLSSLEGAAHVSVVADFRKADDIGRIVDAAGELNGLVHCAGVTAVVPFRVIGEKHLDEILETNFRAPMMLTQRLLAGRHLMHGGSIVFIASSAAHIGTPFTSMYSASKSALITAARALALEVAAKQRIRVNCLSPGYTRTPMLESLNEGASVEGNFALAPLGIGEPEDLANAVIFFLSDASCWITRATLHIDGGLTARVSY